MIKRLILILWIGSTPLLQTCSAETANPPTYVDKVLDDLKALYPACAIYSGQDFEMCVADAKEEKAYWRQRRLTQENDIKERKRQREYYEFVSRQNAINNMSRSTTTTCNRYNPNSVTCVSY